nr:neprilysin [Halyomorpha halys]
MDILVQLSLSVDNTTNLTIVAVGPGVAGSSLPELVPRSEDQKPSVGARDAVALRLAYMAGVLAELDPTANITALPALSLKVLVVDAQVKTDIQKTEPGSTPVKMTFAELQELMDSANTTGTPKLRLDWSEYLNELMTGLNTQIDLNDTVLVENRDYFVALASRLHKSRPETYQRYIWWAVVSSMVPHTTTELRGLRDELYEALFKRPRHTRPFKCAKYVKSFLNMAISYKFATINDLKETSEKVKWMLRDITSSFKELVASLPWMDLETKEATWKKASSIKSYIGYPKWLLEDGELEKFYKHVEINDGQFLESMVSIKAAEVRTILESVGEPPNNQSLGWLSDPLDVNAYYGRGGNAIAIPAGILQTPFYYLGLEALNYGAIGSILGHELTHAFDIEGKEYDGEGRKISWWSDEMTKQYNDRAQCFVKQYDKFAVNKINKVNGTLTLAENIADNGGVREALHAYRYYVKRNGEEPYLPGLEHYTHEQLFFLAFANVWCEKTIESDEIMSLGDVHSPNKFRVLGTLGNSPEFADAWNCPKKTKMNPENKCILW